MAAVGTGVSIGSRTVRVLSVKQGKDGSWLVTKALTAPLSSADLSPARRAAEARAAIQTTGAKGQALASLSGRDLIVRYTQVPPVPDWRLEMLMNFEIQEVAEQSGGDVSAAYALLDVDDTTSGDNVVLVALAKNGYLKPHIEALKGSNLDVLGGCPRAVGAFWAYKENGHLRHDETVVIMHIGNENTDVAIARAGVLLFARNVTGGSKLFTDALVENMRVNPATAEKLKITKGNLTPRGQARYRDSGEEKVANNLMGVGGHFVSAFNSSVMFAKAQTKVPDCQPDRMVVMGAGAMLRGLPEYLESNLGVPVEVFDPLDSIDLSELSSEAQNALRQEQGAIASTLGLAQLAADADAPQVHILPEAEKKRREFAQQTMPMLIGAAILAIAMVLAFIMAGSAYDEAVAEKGQLDQLAREFNENRGLAKAASDRVAKVNDEKFRLRRMVALGPATQRILDLIENVINEGNFEEIHITNVKASMNEITVNGERELVPEVVIDAMVQSVGSRPPAEAQTAFSVGAKSSVQTKFGLEYAEIGAPQSSGAGSVEFKFRIRQMDFPEREPAADAGNGEGS